jgi:hypothetical protein
MKRNVLLVGLLTLVTTTALSQVLTEFQSDCKAAQGKYPNEQRRTIAGLYLTFTPSDRPLADHGVSVSASMFV